MRKTRQLDRLQRGRDFEHRVKSQAVNATGPHDGSTIFHEEVIVIDGRRRRVDMLLELDPDGNEEFAVVIEIKSSDWATMDDRRLRRNACRHASQVLRYVDGCVNVLGKNAAAGILYERSPSDPAAKRFLEEYHDSRGVQVIWADDPGSQNWV